MTNGDIRRVQYVNQRQTLRKISEETGIPASSLSYISRGLRNVPRVYKTTLANYYRREAYDRLREVGLSSYQANRFRWHAPETVLNVEQTIKEKAMSLALGTTAAALRNVSGPVGHQRWTEIYLEHYKNMVKAFQKSPKTYEAIEKYGTREEMDKPH